MVFVLLYSGTALCPICTNMELFYINQNLIFFYQNTNRLIKQSFLCAKCYIEMW